MKTVLTVGYCWWCLRVVFWLPRAAFGNRPCCVSLSEPHQLPAQDINWWFIYCFHEVSCFKQRAYIPIMSLQILHVNSITEISGTLQYCSVFSFQFSDKYYMPFWVQTEVSWRHPSLVGRCPIGIHLGLGAGCRRDARQQMSPVGSCRNSAIDFWNNIRYRC